jgi:hypothetical protein
MSRWIAWTVTAVIVSLMALSVVGEVWLMPREIDFVVRRFPETQPLQVPSLIWGVIVISSWQVVLAVGLWAMFRERRGLVVLTRSLTAWVASPLLVVLVLAVSAFVVLSHLGYMPPAVLFVLVFMGLISLVTAVSITVAYLVGPGDYAKHAPGARGITDAET